METGSERKNAASEPEQGSGPRLDHVSLAATPESIANLGLRLTPTPGFEEHARVFLDGCYLEVTPPSGARDGLVARGWFLGVPDLQAAAADLTERGIEVSGPARYEGHDGAWLDLTIVGESRMLPRLTRRLDISSADWPPPLEQRHPNGAITIAALHLSCAEPEPVASALALLGARDAGRSQFGLADGCTIEIERTGSSLGEGLGVVLDRDDAPQLRIEFAA